MAHSGSTTRIRRQSPSEASKRSPAAHSSAAAAKYRGDLEEQVRSVGKALNAKGKDADHHRTRATLDQIADILSAGGAEITADDYGHLLQQLIRIYSGGDARREYSAFAATASAYARVVKALSRRCPACDYRDAIGQLLHLMTGLFETRDPSWKSIFRLLRAIPTSVKGRERLQHVCSMHVREWFDSGVPNHYSLERELHREIEQDDMEIAIMRREIRIAEEELKTIETSTGTLEDPKIASLAAKRKARQIVQWRREVHQTLDEHDAKMRVAERIASDIEDLGNRLRNAGRAYRLRLL